jgi:hypothetical protein
MLKEQKKKILEIFELNSLNPLDFDLQSIDDKVKITHKDSQLFFVFQEHPGNQDYYTFQYSCFTSKRGVNGSSEYEQFGIMLNHFIKWIENHVKVYINEQIQVDPWEELKNYRELNFQSINNNDTDFFRPEEKLDLLKHISEFENILSQKFNLNSAQQSEIKEQLKYLASRVDNLNKRDWKAVAQRVIYDIGLIILGNSITAKIPDEFWDIVKQVFILIKQLPPIRI